MKRPRAELLKIVQKLGTLKRIKIQLIRVYEEMVILSFEDDTLSWAESEITEWCFSC